MVARNGLLILLLAGCTTIGHEKVEGWPVLKTFEQEVGLGEAKRICGKYVSWLQVPLGCAIFNLQALTCHVYYVNDYALRHERLHCQGYDHVGEDSMAKFLQKWREYEKRQAP